MEPTSLLTNRCQVQEWRLMDIADTILKESERYPLGSWPRVALRAAFFLVHGTALKSKPALEVGCDQANHAIGRFDRAE